MGKAPGAKVPVKTGDVLKSRGRVRISYWRDTVYLSGWPKPRVKQRSARVLAWMCNFRKIARMSKTPTPQEFDRATEIARGTKWYYRDVIETALSGKLMTYRGEKRVLCPTVKVHRANSQNVNNSTTTLLTPDALDWDNNAFWNSSVNSSRLTFRNAGLYQLGARVVWDNNNQGFRYIRFDLNGVLIIMDDTEANAAGATQHQPMNTIYYFHAGDYVEMKAFQNSGGTRPCRIEDFWAIAMTPEALQP